MASHPRWINALTKALALPENKGQNIYSVATRDAAGPRVRSQVHREVLYPKGNPELPVLLTTTDIRTPKVTQIINHPRIEIAWWLEGSRDQFRISGIAQIIPHSEHPARVDVLSEGHEGEGFAALDEERVDWEQKRREIFDSMSSHMRASWCRPTPGSVIPSYDEAKKWPSSVPKFGEAQNAEDEKNQKTAYGNFAIILVDPIEVDWVEMGVVPNQRTRFRKETKGEDTVWVEEILVP